MRRIQNKIVSFLLIVFILGISFLFTQNTNAGDEHNVTGFAWSENTGWISHNSSDTGSVVNYGVNISASGGISGYAWNDNYGWIDYSPLGPYPKDINYSAQYNPCTNKIGGWAKIISLDDDGWVLLSSAEGDPVSYGVVVDPITGNFSGYAWSSELGWIDYNPILGGVNATNLPVCTSGVEYNVSGFSWSDTYGWISHNYKDTDSPWSYGVNLNQELVNNKMPFSGYAWGDNIGWIQYDAPGPYPAEPQHSAMYDPCTNDVSGWIKADSLGDDGWILLSSSGGVAFGVTINQVTGDFNGYAWGDNPGWIQYDPVFGGVSTLSSLLTPPPVEPELLKPFTIDLSSDIWFDYYPEFIEAPLLPTFSWEPYGSTNCGGEQLSYTIEVSTDLGFDPGALFYYIQTVEISSSGHAIMDSLDWDMLYYWRVKVTNTNNQESPWGEIGKSGEINRFKTPKHSAPDADFDTLPLLIDLSARDEVNFFDRSTAYGGSTIVNWKWEFGDGAVLEGSDTEIHKNPVYQYKEEGIYTIKLTVTDSDGYWASKILSNVPVKLPLPEFRRTGP